MQLKACMARQKMIESQYVRGRRWKSWLSSLQYIRKRQARILWEEESDNRPVRCCEIVRAEREIAARCDVDLTNES